ncbi:MAG: pyridoxal phosphate-dependent aminotransferase, partial [Thermoplasmatota archaeon]
TCGSTSGLYATMASFVNPGDEVLCPDPGFVIYAPHARLVNGKPLFYPLREDKKYIPQVEDLEPLITRKTKAVVFNSPSNPTGATIPKRDLAELAAWADRHSLVLISDEAYDSITYEEPHASFLGASPNVVYLNTFSKAYAMTGWRIGYAIAKPAFADALKKMNYHLVACPPTPTQWACLAALEGPQDRVREMVAQFRERRDLIVKRLKDIPGFDLAPPRGAFYAFPNYKQHITAENFALKLLEAGVVTIPGDAFGPRGAKHLRFSYATSSENIERGLDIVKKVAETIK